jgi:hypothetical protein
MNEEELWKWMMEGNYPPTYDELHITLHRRALATLSQDITYKATVDRKVMLPYMKRKGRKTTREVDKILTKGTRVNVVMASRMGDVGITPNLDAEHGYCTRIICIEGEWDMFGDGKRIIQLQPEGVLVDIELIEDPRSDKVKLAFPTQDEEHDQEKDQEKGLQEKDQDQGQEEAD